MQKSVVKSSTQVFRLSSCPQIQDVYGNHSSQRKNTVFGVNYARDLLLNCPSEIGFKVKLPDDTGGGPAVWSACRACPGFRVCSWSSWGRASCSSGGSHWSPAGRDSERGRDGTAGEWGVTGGCPIGRREAQREEKPQPYVQDRSRRRTSEDTTGVNSKNQTAETAPLLIQQILMGGSEPPFQQQTDAPAPSRVPDTNQPRR